MPGVGKSTLGVILAKALGKNFIDTDLLLQNLHQKLLHDIIRIEGIDEFIRKEESLIKSLTVKESIIATGGSVVLSDNAMLHLKSIGTVVFLKIDISTIAKRINNIETRGIVKEKNQSLSDIFKIRTPLYEKFSDITIDCNNKDFENIINEIVDCLKSLKPGNNFK